MLFRRRNPAGRTFSSGEFKIARPSGAKNRRDGLDFSAAGRDFDVRLERNEIWLMEDERLVGYADGDASSWRLLIDETPYAIEQPKLGNNYSLVSAEGEDVAEIGGGGFPLRSAEIRTELDLTAEQKAFMVMIALVGWRESDRALLGNVRNDEGSQ
jgi:hypothetical protein